MPDRRLTLLLVLAAFLLAPARPAAAAVPECFVNVGAYGPENESLIYSRPGAVRGGVVSCSDQDADLYSLAILSPPTNGTAEFTASKLPQYMSMYEGRRSFFLRYVPAARSTDTDFFTVQAQAPDGASRPIRIGIVPREPPANGHGGCGWAKASSYGGNSAPLQLWCNDADGDPLSVEVVRGPANGTLGTPLGEYTVIGDQHFEILYRPAPGFGGTETVDLRVTDGFGFQEQLTVEVQSDISPPPTPPPPPDLAQVLLAYAQQTFGRAVVRLTELAPDTQVWTPDVVSRPRLRRKGRAPAMLILCGRGCVVNHNTARRRTVVLWAKRAPRQRSVTVRATIRWPGGKRVVRRTLPIGR